LDGAGPRSKWWQRVQRYGKARGRSDDLIEYLTDLETAAAVKARRGLLSCGSYLEFREYLTRPDVPVKLHKATFCQRWRLCELCAIRRSAKLLRAYAPRLATLVASGLHGYFATWTVRTGPDLAERFEHVMRALGKCCRGMREQRVKGGWLKGHAWAGLVGHMTSAELKRGGGTRSGGGWHAHLHGVYLARDPLDEGQRTAIKQAWCDATGDSDIRGQFFEPLRSSVPADVSDQAAEVLLEAVGDELAEVIKYPLKCGDLPPADRYAAALAVQGRHMLRTGGVVRGVEVDPSYLDAPLELGDLPYVQWILRYAGGGKFRTAAPVFVDG
jgi:hypothetical protein